MALAAAVDCASAAEAKVGKAATAAAALRVRTHFFLRIPCGPQARKKRAA
jgi:hypothetical protein